EEYWKARELEGIENLNKAYHHNPEIVVGNVILTGKRIGRSWPTVPLDLLVVLPVERVVSFTWSLTLLIMRLTPSLELFIMLSPKPDHFGSLSKGRRPSSWNRSSLLQVIRPLMRGEPMWKFAMVLVLLSNLGRLAFSMASKSITLFSPRVARSRMVKTTLGYRVPATVIGSLFSEQPIFGSTIFPFTIAPMVLSMSFK
ncbi:hypothetical protein Gotri_026756, partial [Gossypium trilobum]|nr:hypothetical protein [Gossypium trilobum]